VPGLLALALAGFARPLFARCDRCRTLSCSTPLDATSLAAPGWPSTWVLRSSCPVSGEPSASARTRWLARGRGQRGRPVVPAWRRGRLLAAHPSRDAPD